MKNSLLLIEDSKEVYQMITQSLATSLLNIDWAQSIKEAEKLLSERNYQIILLDIELPDGNGLNLCSLIQQKTPELPIFILTSHTTLSDKVLGFSAGADDYITKPFDILEVKARVESRLRKIELMKASNEVLHWKEIEINKLSREVKINFQSNNELINLTALEFKILIYLAHRTGEVIERDTMLNDIWGEDVHVYARSVDTHVSKLRKKLGPVSHIIESIHGVGYKFGPTVS